MSESVEQIIAAADWKKLTPRLMYYADSLIRRCAWRGLPVQATVHTKVSVEGFGADDFVQEAIDRLLAGQRQYNPSVSLELNLRSIIRSMIWSLNKSSLRAGIVELARPEDDESADPIANLPSSTASASDAAMAVEETERQKQMLNKFEASIAEEEELLAVFTSLKTENLTPRGVEKLTAIPAAKVSELKRQLRRRMERFIERRATTK